MMDMQTSMTVKYDFSMNNITPRDGKKMYSCTEELLALTLCVYPLCCHQLVIVRQGFVPHTSMYTFIKITLPLTISVTH